MDPIQLSSTTLKTLAQWRRLGTDAHLVCNSLLRDIDASDAAARLARQEERCGVCGQRIDAIPTDGHFPGCEAAPTTSSNDDDDDYRLSTFASAPRAPNAEPRRVTGGPGRPTRNF
jgi:hypothetical protein